MGGKEHEGMRKRGRGLTHSLKMFHLEGYDQGSIAVGAVREGGGGGR